MLELPDERVDLAERELQGGAPLEIAAEEAIGRCAGLESSGAGVIGDGDAVFLRQGEDAEQPPDAQLSILAVDMFAYRADMRSGGAGPAQNHLCRLRRARGLVLFADAVPAALLAQVLAQKLAGLWVEQPHAARVPLHRHSPSDISGRRAVIGAVHLDAAVEMHRPLAILIVTKGFDRQRQQRRLLLGKHHRDLALGGAVDASVCPARLPAVEILLRLLEPLCDLTGLPLAYGVFTLLIALLLPLGWLRWYAVASLAIVLAHVLAAAWAGPDFFGTVKLLTLVPYYILRKLVMIPGVLRGSSAKADWVRTERDNTL